jgi:Hydrogenase maturation factor
MDLEGYAKRLILKKEDEADLKLKNQILEIKSISEEEALKLAAAILEETNAALSMKGEVFEYYKSDVGMGEFGVGSRGYGDFYVHGKIGQVIGDTSAVLDSSNSDDSGVVSLEGNSNYLVLTVDGIHSRLSAFPFLAGFHVAKAALRDIYVMGSKPSAMLSDIHVADDGDVSMIFDHLAGISAVSELTGIPLITGSTLRIGGDMVIGDRMTGCVGAAGAMNAESLTARNKAEPGDLILMTEGTGGGTVTTAAIYSNYEKAEEVVNKTLNVDFLIAVQAILDSENELHKKIHVMTDVTNGGVRGDAFEISKEADVRLIFDDDALLKCVEPTVSKMFDFLKIDFRGVSIDSLLVICPPEISNEIIQTVEKVGVKMYVVGRIEEKESGKFDTALIVGGEEKEFKPLFREAAYTPLKKVIGEKAPSDFEAMKKKVDEAANAAVLKKEKIVEEIKKRKETGK